MVEIIIFVYKTLPNGDMIEDLLAKEKDCVEGYMQTNIFVLLVYEFFCVEVNL
jgi:hypothetical protein